MNAELVKHACQATRSRTMEAQNGHENWQISFVGRPTRPPPHGQVRPVYIAMSRRLSGQPFDRRIDIVRPGFVQRPKTMVEVMSRVPRVLDVIHKPRMRIREEVRPHDISVSAVDVKCPKDARRDLGGRLSPLRQMLSSQVDLVPVGRHLLNEPRES
jgi:hypothetical protein